MKLERKILWIMSVVVVIGITSYFVYNDYRGAVIYKECISNNSLDIERQNQIKQYCLDLARN